MYYVRTKSEKTGHAREGNFKKWANNDSLITQTASNLSITHCLMDICALILNWLCCIILYCDVYFSWSLDFIVSISDFCNFKLLLRDTSRLRRDDGYIFNNTFYSTSSFTLTSFLFFLCFLCSILLISLGCRIKYFHFWSGYDVNFVFWFEMRLWHYDYVSSREKRILEDDEDFLILFEALYYAVRSGIIR